ncbi:MAG: FAD-binding protein [Deltaproteobacteria bacterium]|nr:MAG: FAD-binding protein [Deltaproteobacteria bacterium]
MEQLPNMTTFGDVEGVQGVEDACDYVVIGTGAAGATAARVLAEAGLDVVMLEEGSWIPRQSLRQDMYSSLKSLWRDMGFQGTESRAVVAVLQGCTVGGSTAVNSAIIHRLPEQIHAEWERAYGATEHIAYADLESAWERIEDELRIQVTPDEVLGRNGRLLRDACERKGYSVQSIVRNVEGCKGTSRCSQGCPTAQRQSMNNAYVPRALADGARLYTDCRAEKVIREGGRAVGVRGRFRRTLTRERGPELTVRARRGVLVACSAIQTPIFLQANGIGRQSRLVGQRLQMHPGVALAGIFDEPMHCWFGATQSVETLHFWEDRYKIETINLPPELASMRLPGVGTALMEQFGAFKHMAIWGVQCRMRAHGRVRRGALTGRTIVKYDMLPEDVRLAKTALVTMAEMMFLEGAQQVLPGVHGLPGRVSDMDTMRRIFDIPDDPGIFHAIGSHLFGTAVMGQDPRSSVVGTDGQCHELPGLYVMDSSVFPTNMGVNPQHTICGVSWLFAQRLANEERATAAA